MSQRENKNQGNLIYLSVRCVFRCLSTSDSRKHLLHMPGGTENTKRHPYTQTMYRLCDHGRNERTRKIMQDRRLMCKPNIIDITHPHGVCWAYLSNSDRSDTWISLSSLVLLVPSLDPAAVIQQLDIIEKHEACFCSAGSAPPVETQLGPDGRQQTDVTPVVMAYRFAADHQH